TVLDVNYPFVILELVIDLFYGNVRSAQSMAIGRFKDASVWHDGSPFKGVVEGVVYAFLRCQLWFILIWSKAYYGFVLVVLVHRNGFDLPAPLGFQFLHGQA